MDIDLGWSELANLGTQFGSVTVVPTRVQSNDREYTVYLRVVPDGGPGRVEILRGARSGDRVHAAFDGARFSVDLRNGRLRSDNEPDEREAFVPRDGGGAHDAIRWLEPEKGCIWLRVARTFAAKNLSRTCLKLAEKKTGRYYQWYLTDTGYAVLYELPILFGVELFDLVNGVFTFCPEYAAELGLSVDEFTKRYDENLNKDILL